VKIQGKKPERLATAHFEFLNRMDYFRSDGEWAKLKGKYKKWYDALMSKKKIVQTTNGRAACRARRDHGQSVLATSACLKSRT